MNQKKKFWTKSRLRIAATVLGIFMFLTLTAESCSNQESAADKLDRETTDDAMEQYTVQVPIPVFEFPWVRYMLSEIYRAKNDGSAILYAYVTNDYLGVKLWGCPTFGYPFPGGTQMTNPERVLDRDGADLTVPLAEPDSTFAPSGAMATMVPCILEDGTVFPRYEEAEVHVAAYPADVVDGREVPIGDTTTTFSINVGNRPTEGQ